MEKLAAKSQAPLAIYPTPGGPSAGATSAASRRPQDPEAAAATTGALAAPQQAAAVAAALGRPQGLGLEGLGAAPGATTAAAAGGSSSAAAGGGLAGEQGRFDAWGAWFCGWACAYGLISLYILVSSLSRIHTTDLPTHPQKTITHKPTPNPQHSKPRPPGQGAYAPSATARFGLGAAGDEARTLGGVAAAEWGGAFELSPQWAGNYVAASPQVRRGLCFWGGGWIGGRVLWGKGRGVGQDQLFCGCR